MTSLAFIGLGAMGSRMARRLVDAGHELTVWNRTQSKAEDLAKAGAKVAATPREAAANAEAVITMVADPDALRAVTEGDEGIARGAGKDATVIEMSTVGPAAIAWLASALPAGTSVMDAPVLGSLAEAEGGTLRIFAGGDDALIQKWMPLLNVMGTPLHAGPLGAGASAKLVANSTLIGVLTVLAEVLALADRLGLSREVTFEVLSFTPVAAQAERRRESVLTGNYPKRFALSLGTKDAGLITRAGADAGIDLRVLKAARDLFAEAEKAGWGDRDYAEIIRWLLERGNAKRISPDPG